MPKYEFTPLHHFVMWSPEDYEFSDLECAIADDLAAQGLLWIRRDADQREIFYPTLMGRLVSLAWRIGGLFK